MGRSRPASRKRLGVPATDLYRPVKRLIDRGEIAKQGTKLEAATAPATHERANGAGSPSAIPRVRRGGPRRLAFDADRR